MNYPEQAFEDIANRTIEEAEKVKCGFGDFVEGLRTIETMVKERRQMAEDEAHSER